MHIYDTNLHCRIDFFQTLLYRVKRAVWWLTHIDSSQQVYHRHFYPAGQGVCHIALARRFFGQICRSNDPFGFAQHSQPFAFTKDVVAHGDHIHPVGQQLIVYRTAYSRAARGVFRIGNHAVYLTLRHESFKLLSQNLSSGLAHHVAHTQDANLHNLWFPAFVFFPRPQVSRLKPSYLAYSTQRTSRNSVTLTSPGYCSSCSTFSAISLAIFMASPSFTFAASTRTRTSRPAWIA